MTGKLDLTDVIGHFGKYQRKLLFITIYRHVCIAMVMLNMLFVSRTPVFRCAQNENNFTMKNEWYLLNRTKNHECEMTMEASDEGNFTTLLTIPCQDFEFSTHNRFSIAQEWNLICSRKWIVSLGYLVFSLANLVTFIPMGFVMDKFGRRLPACFGLLIMLIGTAATVMSNNFITFLSFRFFLGIGYALTLISISLIYLESIGPSKKYTICFTSAGWNIGIVILSGISWLIDDWRYITLVQVVFQAFLFFLVFRYTTESLRWLLARRSYGRAKKLLEKILDENSIEIDDIESTMISLKQKIEEDSMWHVKATFCTLLQTPSIRLIGLSLSAIGFFRSVITRGFEISISRFGGSFHANLCAMALSKLCMSFVSLALIKYVPRKATFICSGFLSSLCFFVSAAITELNLQWLEITLAILGSVLTSSTIDVFNIHLQEVFPTNTRATMTGSIKALARFGQIIGPFTDLLGGIYGRYVVLILFGVCSFFVGIASFVLPETRDLNLPDTLNEAKKIARKAPEKSSNDSEDENIESMAMTSRNEDKETSLRI